MWDSEFTEMLPLDDAVEKDLSARGEALRDLHQCLLTYTAKTLQSSGTDDASQVNCAMIFDLLFQGKMYRVNSIVYVYGYKSTLNTVCFFFNGPVQFSLDISGVERGQEPYCTLF